MMTARVMLMLARAAGVACLKLCVYAVEAEAQTVQTDFDRGFEFARLKTFGFAG